MGDVLSLLGARGARRRWLDLHWPARVLARQEGRFFGNGENGKESLNFQLSMLVYQVAAIVVSFVTCGLGLPINLALLVCSVAMPIIAGMKVNQGLAYRYPMTIRFIA